jgi:hypothetical protein
MATEFRSPKPAEPCGFPNGLPLWGGLLLVISAVFVGSAGLLIWEPYCQQRQQQKVLEELDVSFGPGAVDPDPDWLRRLSRLTNPRGPYLRAE